MADSQWITGDFSTWNDCDPILDSSLLIKSYRMVQICLYSSFIYTLSAVQTPIDRLCTFLYISFHEVDHIALMTTIFHVFCRSNDIKTGIPCLMYPVLWSHVTVRIDRMQMKVSLIDIITVHLWQYYLCPYRRHLS